MDTQAEPLCAVVLATEEGERRPGLYVWMGKRDMIRGRLKKHCINPIKSKPRAHKISRTTRAFVKYSLRFLFPAGKDTLATPGNGDGIFRLETPINSPSPLDSPQLPFPRTLNEVSEMHQNVAHYPSLPWYHNLTTNMFPWQKTETPSEKKTTNFRADFFMVVWSQITLISVQWCNIVMVLLVDNNGELFESLLFHPALMCLV